MTFKSGRIVGRLINMDTGENIALPVSQTINEVESDNGGSRGN